MKAHKCIVPLLTAMITAILAIVLTGCGSDTPVATTVQGDRAASSLPEYVQLLLDDVDRQQADAGTAPIADSQRTILEHALSNDGKISASDYERSWSDYRSCITERGYRPRPVYRVGDFYDTTINYDISTMSEAQQNHLDQDESECFAMYVVGVQEVYLRQNGNPNLYKEEEPGVVDCLHRANAVAVSYTVDQYKEERKRYDAFLTQRGQSTAPPVAEANEYFSFDLTDSAVADCLVCNHSTLPGLTDAYEVPEWKPYG